MEMSIILEKLEDIRNYLDVEVHPVVSPDRWDVYSALCDMVDGIITLLKEQSPHLLTLEEVRQSDTVFLETHGWSGLANEEIHETVLHTDEDRYDFSDVIVQFVDQEGCEIVCVKDRYNIEWRCWNRKPSYEQWKEKQWNA